MCFHMFPTVASCWLKMRRSDLHFHSHRIHVWYICLHLVDFYAKIPIGWSIWLKKPYIDPLGSLMPQSHSSWFTPIVLHLINPGIYKVGTREHISRVKELHLQGATVDGSEIQLSPLEVGSWSTIKSIYPSETHLFSAIYRGPILHLQRSRIQPEYMQQEAVGPVLSGLSLQSKLLAWQKKGWTVKPPLDPSCFLVPVKDSGYDSNGGNKPLVMNSLTLIDLNTCLMFKENRSILKIIYL